MTDRTDGGGGRAQQGRLRARRDRPNVIGDDGVVMATWNRRAASRPLSGGAGENEKAPERPAQASV